MPKFRYLASGAAGRPVAGTVEAEGPDSAAEALRHDGLMPRGIVPEPLGEPPGASARPLSEADGVEFARCVADAVASQQTLPDGLRALADDLPSGRLRRTLERVAARAAQGVPLPDALTEARDKLPEHLRGLIVAGLRAGQLDTLLRTYVEQMERRTATRSRLLAALAYPLIAAALTLAVVVFISVFVSQELFRLSDGFGASKSGLASLSQGFGWLVTQVWSPLLAVLATALLLFWLAQRTGRGERIGWCVPFFGSLGRWFAVAGWLRLVGILLLARVPAAAAVRLSAGATRSPTIASRARLAAADIEAGGPFCEAVSSRLPRAAEFEPLLAWAEREGELPGVAEQIADMLEARAQQRVEFIRAIASPVLFFIAGTLLWLTLTGPLATMLQLLEALT